VYVDLTTLAPLQPFLVFIPSRMDLFLSLNAFPPLSSPHVLYFSLPSLVLSLRDSLFADVETHLSRRIPFFPAWFLLGRLRSPLFLHPPFPPSLPKDSRVRYSLPSVRGKTFSAYTYCMTNSGVVLDPRG